MCLMDQNEREKDLQDTYKWRAEFYQGMGTLDPVVISSRHSPNLGNGPHWPTPRSAWCTVRTNTTTIMGSDGLADPYDNVSEPNSGFGLEVFAETPDKLDISDSNPIQNSWLFHLVHEVTHEILLDPKFRYFIEKFGFVSISIPTHPDLSNFQGQDGSVGVLLGVPKPGIPPWAFFPGGECKFISIKLLTPKELTFAIEQHKGGALLAKRFTEGASHHLSSLLRDSVV
jgi:hypothetical protein